MGFQMIMIRLGVRAASVSAAIIYIVKRLLSRTSRLYLADGRRRGRRQFPGRRSAAAQLDSVKGH